MTYTVIEFLGQGGFARVQKVIDEFGVAYAKKTYEPNPQLLKDVGDVHLKRRFVREVRYQSTIKYPNVVEIVEHFLEDNPPYFIMPLAECTLKEELVSDPTLGENLHTALFGILAGLEFLHMSFVSTKKFWDYHHN